MLIKNFIRLLGEKLNLIGKVFAVLILSSIVFLSISATIFNVQLKDFKKDMQELNIPKYSKELIQDSIYSQKKAKQDVIEGKQKLSELFDKHKKSINASIAYFIILLFAFVTVILTLKYILTVAIKEFMDVGANLRLSNIYIANAVTIIKYSIVSSIVNILLGIIDVLIIYGLFNVIYQFSVFVALSLIGILSTVFIAFNNVLLGQWENMMVINNNGIFKALKNSVIFGFKNFKNAASHIYLLTFISLLFFNAFGVFTFGVGYFVGGVIILIAFRVMVLIEYYEVNNLPYYIAKNTIYYNKNKINNI